MTTSILERSDSRLAFLRRSAPTFTCLALLAAGCGGGSGSSAPSDPGGGGGGTEEPLPLTAPSIALVDPAVGPAAGGTSLRIVGSGFLQGVTGPIVVRLGDQEALDVQVLDDATLTCVTPQGSPATEVDVRVQNSRGTAVLAKGFGYLALPGTTSDLDNDGIADLVISAQFDGAGGVHSGCVYVFFGVEAPATFHDTDARFANIKIMGASAGDRFGASVATGDVNGDGKDDLVVGAPRVNTSAENSGAVYVFFGPLPESGTLTAHQADVVIRNMGVLKDDWFGCSVAVGDVDGDGIGDLLAGARGRELDPTEEIPVESVGAAYLFYGSTSLSNTLASQANVILLGDEENDQFGNACLLVDIDGDDRAEVIVAGFLANPVVPPKKYDAGAVYVFLSSAPITSGRASSASLVLSGEQPYDELGSSLGHGDVDGDGIQDLVVGAPGSQALGSEAGRAYLFLGSAQPTTRNAAQADAIYSGQQANADFGRAVTCADFDGDGYDDVAVGAPLNSFGANRNGRCFVFRGGIDPRDGLAHFADVIYTGEYLNLERFGSALEVIDLDGDGLADAVTSAIGNGAAGQGAGRVYVFQGDQNLEDRGATQDDVTITGEAAEANFGSSISRGM